MVTKKRKRSLTKVLSGKCLSEQITEQVRTAITVLNLKLKLLVLTTGSAASVSHQRQIVSACRRSKIDVELKPLPEEQTEALSLLEKASADKNITGILIQFPLPKSLNFSEVIKGLAPEKDIDGLHPLNMGQLACSRTQYRPFLPPSNKGAVNEALSKASPYFVSCSAEAVFSLLCNYDEDILSKKCNLTIIGRSPVLGTPLSLIFQKTAATVTTCHQSTLNASSVCKAADILVACFAKAKAVDRQWVKEGAIVVDMGINPESDTTIVGSVDEEDIDGVAAALAPVPGGVGPITVSIMLRHILYAALMRSSSLSLLSRSS